MKQSGNNIYSLVGKDDDNGSGVEIGCCIVISLSIPHTRLCDCVYVILYKINILIMLKVKR